ncbi:TetR/AcrR family transcriptional regulator [Falsigemmobacter intermedius]|nr:TetR/AcrR family transcriptional regulator [Falsigemmobacter intermedius]
METMPSRGRGRPRDSAIDDRILAEVLAEIARNGLGGFSLASVAQRTGLARASIYLRWPDRNSLILAALETTGVTLDIAHTEDLETDLRSILRQWGDILRNEDLLLVFNRISVDRRDFPEIQSFYMAHIALPANQKVEEALLAHQRAGRIPPDLNMRVVTRMLIGTLHQQGRFNPSGLTGAFVEDLLSLTLRALRA